LFYLWVGNTTVAGTASEFYSNSPERNGKTGFGRAGKSDTGVGWRKARRAAVSRGYLGMAGNVR